MPTQKTYPIPEPLKPLRAVFDERPSLADDLVDLLDWTLDEVRDLLNGQVEPEQEDWTIINGLMQHLQRQAHANQNDRVAA